MHNLLIAIASLLFINFKLYCQDSISLEVAIELAIKNNVQLKKSRLNILLAENNLKASKRELFPSLNATASTNFNFGRNEDPFSSEFFNTRITASSGSVSTSIPVLQLPQKLKLISQNKLLLNANKNILEKLKNDLELNVLTGYLEILYNRDVLKTTDLQLDLAKKSLEQEQKQFDLGNHTIVDLSQAKARGAAAEQSQTNAFRQFKVSSLDLEQLLEWPSGQELKLAAIQLSTSAENEVQHGLGEFFSEETIALYPAVKAAHLQTKAAAKAVEIAKFNALPRLTLHGSLASGYSSIRQRVVIDQSGAFQNVPATFAFQVRDNFNQYIGLGITIPLLNSGSAKLAIERTKVNLESAELDEIIERNSFRKIITQSLLDVETSVAQLAATKNAFEAARNAFQAVEQRYKVGLVNSLSLTQAQTSMNIAEFDLIKARYEMFFRKAIIRFYQGLPLRF